MVDQAFWDQSYQHKKLCKPAQDDFLSMALLKFIPHSNGGKAIEIGCYPGGFLTVLGDLGYELHGIDRTPYLPALAQWLSEQGYRVGELSIADFHHFSTPLKFDVVCSFGFIEHFRDYLDLLKKHAQLVEKNGYLFISTPNFRGTVQRIFHFLLDHKNLKRHHLQSMNPKAWKETLLSLNFEIVFSGYGGGAHFWIAKDAHPLQKLIARGLLYSKKTLGKLFHLHYSNWNHPAIASDCFIVAKKL